MKILLVDDSPLSRLMVRRCIGTAGVGDHLFCFAGDGAQALVLIEAGGIDVLVTDLNMPVLDGRELLRAIDGDDLHRPRLIVMITSAVTPALVDDLKRLDVDAVVHKPISVAAFAEAFTYMHAGTDRFSR